MVSVEAKYPPGGDRPIYGSQAPAHFTGAYYPPQYYFSDATDMSSTATRLYYCPILITELRQYAGFVIRNTGAGDSGDKCRPGIYASTNGRPGTLLQAGAEITFGGSAADNVSAGAFTPPALGWYWLAQHYDAATTLKRMYSGGQQFTAVGYVPPLVIISSFGFFSMSDFSAASASYPGAYYVDTAYGALASTAVAPTAGTSICPAIALIA